MADAFEDAVQCVQKGRLAEAEALCRQILIREPDHANAWNTLGAIARLRGDAHTAAACIRKALGLLPEFPEALNNLGLVLESMHKLPEAIECYRRALELRPMVMIERGHKL